MEKKLGVYICRGCGIGESVDTEKLAAVGRELKAPVCKTNAAFCLDEGLREIKNDVEKEGVNAVVIAACSPRAMTHVFNFPDQLVERVNLREHVAWCQPAKEEDTQLMAEDYLRMGIVRTQKSTLPEPTIRSSNKTILVVGGGKAGMTAALEAARTGYETILIEKTPHLGGWASKFHKQFPTKSPYVALEQVDLHPMIEEIRASSKIQVFTQAEVQKIAGEPGNFTVLLAHNSTTTEVKAGAVVMATGFKPYDPNKLGHLGYGRFQNVVTHVDVEEMAKQGKIARPSDGKPVQSVAYILCAGSRDANHLPYCSSFCCMSSLKQAAYIREQNPDSKVFIFYRDIRTPGHQELFYKKIQQDVGVFMTKADFSDIAEGPDKTLMVEVDNTLIGGKMRVQVDMVVLATGVVPTTLEEHVLNLQYRQGPDVPITNYGFVDSNFICFQYETRRTGIYSAGCVRQPGDLMTVGEDAAGAAMKAIQCIELSTTGAAVHPRAKDLSFPKFALEKCTQCKRCTEECPFGALEENEKGTPVFNLGRCRRCGICMGACPVRIINFDNYGVDIIGSMIKSIHVPDEFSEKPRILALMCENDAYPALDMAGHNRIPVNANVRVIPVRCLGSVNVVWISDALSRGFDGIMMVGCKTGDDYQCHFITGSELASKRMDNVKETLERLMLEPDRIKFVNLAIDEYNRIPGIMNEFVESVVQMGFNPYKGM